MFVCKQKSQFHTNYFRAEKYRKYRYYRYFFFDIDIQYFFNVATAKFFDFFYFYRTIDNLNLLIGYCTIPKLAAAVLEGTIAGRKEYNFDIIKR